MASMLKSGIFFLMSSDGHLESEDFETRVISYSRQTETLISLRFNHNRLCHIRYVRPNSSSEMKDHSDFSLSPSLFHTCEMREALKKKYFEAI